MIKAVRSECEAALAERDMARDMAETARADLDVARAEAATARAVNQQLREEAEPILRRLVEAEEALGVRSAFRRAGPPMTSETLRKEVEAARIERQAEQQALASARIEIDALQARVRELEAAPADRFPPPLRRS